MLLSLFLWQHGGEFKVALNDVLMAWKHLLLDKLHLLPPSPARLENYDLIVEAYESFLKRSNTIDLIDLLFMYKQLRLVDSDPEEPVSLVSWLKSGWWCWLWMITLATQLEIRPIGLSPLSLSAFVNSFAKIQLFEFLSGNVEVPELPVSSVPSTPSGKGRSCSSQVGPTVFFLLQWKVQLVS